MRLNRPRGFEVLALSGILVAGCGPLHFHRSPDSVINVQGSVFAVSPQARCELKLLSPNGRTIETFAITPVFDRSVVIAPAHAKRVFEVSCAGQRGTFRSRAYKSNGLLEIDLGTIFLTSVGDDLRARRH
jgi:hypothetical protein